MDTIRERLRGVADYYAATLRALFTIPPRSESMAGVIILFVFMNSMATSIWMFNAWTPFVFLLFNRSNRAVGIVSGVNGFFELSCALLSGHVADKLWGPSRTLIFAVRLGMVNLCVVALAVWAKMQWLLIVAQVFEGCYMGLSFTCVESVFAQCLRDGERDRLYSVKFSAESAGPIIGLILSIILYGFVGTEWNVRVLQVIMSFGLVLHLTSMLLFSYSFVALPSHLDRKREAAEAAAAAAVVTDGMSLSSHPHGKDTHDHDDYEIEDERVTDQAADDLSAALEVQRSNTELLNCARTSIMMANNYNCPPPITSRYEPSVCTARNEEAASLRQHTDAALEGTAAERAASGTVGLDGGYEEREGSTTAMSPTRAGEAKPVVDVKNVPPGAHIEYVDHEYLEASACRRHVMDVLPLRIYPVCVVVCDIVLVAGSGMTTQYFSLFMMENYKVSLATIAALNLCNSFVIAFMAIVNGALGKRYGRIRALVPPKLVGALLLLYMALAQSTVYGPKFWMCVSYVFRNALMNCSAGLSRALIMDLVPEERRGRWNALESVQSAGWSGSAIIGGIIADRHGYGTAFIFTFMFHFFSVAALSPLMVRNDARLPQPMLVYDDASVQPADEALAGDAKRAIAAADRTATPPPTSAKRVVVAELTAENVRKIASCASLHREVEESVPESSEKASSHARAAPEAGKPRP